MEGVQVGLCRATAHRSLWFSSLEKSENIFRSSTETKKTFLKVLQIRVKKKTFTTWKDRKCQTEGGKGERRRGGQGSEEDEMMEGWKHFTVTTLFSAGSHLQVCIHGNNTERQLWDESGLITFYLSMCWIRFEHAGKFIYAINGEVSEVVHMCLWCTHTHAHTRTK